MKAPLFCLPLLTTSLTILALLSVLVGIPQNPLLLSRHKNVLTQDIIQFSSSAKLTIIIVVYTYLQ